jgi:hypothetical protein
MMDFRHLLKASLAAAAIALAVSSAPAAAQWMWKDEAGHVIASDQAPPPGTPESRIMKAPRQKPVKQPVTPPPDPNAPEPQKSVADRELDAKMKQKEQADAAKKADDDAARAQAMKENCAAVRSNVAALQAGGRAARYNDKGEKVYIGDDDRQAEIAKQQAQVAQYCKG